LAEGTVGWSVAFFAVIVCPAALPYYELALTDSSSESLAMQASTRPTALLIALAYIGFISLGLPDAVIGVAWPTIRERFSLPQAALGMIFVASGFGYFLTSFLSGRVTNVLGIGLLLAASTALVAIAMFGFAVAPVWFLFVAGAFIHGLGSGGIDAGLNGYAAHHLSARHMNWLHACYCFGAMIGPLLMTGVLITGRRYSAGYVAVGTLLAALSAMFLSTRPQWGQASITPKHAGPRATTVDALRHPTVLLQIAIFFVYTGLEIAISQWAFTILTECRGESPGSAGIAVAVYWASIGVGRVVFGLIADWVGIDFMLRCCLLLAAAGAVFFAVVPGSGGAFVGLILAGVGLAPVFPCLMTRTPQRLNPAVSFHAIGFQVGAAMIGAAVIPAFLGLIAGRYQMNAIPVGIVIVAVVLWLLHEWLVRCPAVGVGSNTSAASAGSPES
jgi:fucose permease